jgi:two-component system chemotaxis sensor kinase CheA
MMDTNQYLDVFLDESQEHLQAINDYTLQLEVEPQNIAVVNEIFRSAHTLKGMAATMGYEDISSLTHKMENVLDQIRNHKLTVTVEVIDILFIAIEYLEEMVESIRSGKDGKKDVSELMERLERFEKGEVAAALETESDEEKKEAGTGKTLEVTAELDEFQMTVVKQAVEQGYSAYQVNVYVAEDSVLKGARAYMVFEALDDKGEVIHTDPETEEIEEGNFETSFELILLSKETPESLEKTIMGISEITKVKIETIGFHSSNKPSESEAEELVEDSDIPTEAEWDENESTEQVVSSRRVTKTIRVNLERIDDLLNLFEEVVIDQSRLNVLADGIGNQELTETVEHMNRVSSDMQSLILSMRMVEIEQVFNRFPRMIRSLARELDKKINLEIIGADTELDRTVIDEIGDPLVHLIRNSVDHGIEVPEVRIEAGKPEEGNIILRAYHSGNHVFIEIEDDGAGIDVEKVRSKAIKNGLITQQEAEELPNDEIAELILKSGFSTAEKVSDISGRGVGLDVVKNKIESLGGSISIESQEGKGSIFSIQLPLTLSIISTLLVQSQEEIYAIPLSSIIEAVRIKAEEMMTSHGQKVMDFRGQIVPLLDLQKVFNIPDEGLEKGNAVVVLKKGDRLTGLVVDKLIGQQELVLKSLGDYLGDVFAISGATILGDGKVALIIDPNALIK